jgi:hypothetical protein
VTAPVNDPATMNSAPPKGAKVGVKPYPKSRWLPLIVHSMDERGNVYFTWPMSHPTFGRVKALASFNIKHTDWSWKFAADCEFVKGCTKCHASGAMTVDGRKYTCDKCNGEGLVPDHRPFD